MARRSRTVRLDIRLYPGQDDDLIAWVQGLAHEPHGAKMCRLRAALRQGITGGGGSIPAALDLAEIRQVVEAAVSTALARFEGNAITAVPRPAAEDAESEAMLDELGGAVLVHE